MCSQLGHKQGEACCPGAENVGSVEALAVRVEVEANQVAIGGGGLVWNIGSVEVEEEKQGQGGAVLGIARMEKVVEGKSV